MQWSRCERSTLNVDFATFRLDCSNKCRGVGVPKPGHRGHDPRLMNQLGCFLSKRWTDDRLCHFTLCTLMVGASSQVRLKRSRPNNGSGIHKALLMASTLANITRSKNANPDLILFHSLVYASKDSIKKNQIYCFLLISNEAASSSSRECLMWMPRRCFHCC